MHRIVEPELLDVLPVDDPRAVGSRDLRRMNRLMGHARFMASSLECMLPANKAWNLAEIGAGDGTFAAAILRRLQPGRRPRSVTLVDRASVVECETQNTISEVTRKFTTLRADVFDWLKSTPAATVIVANLFLHHFDEKDLKRLLELVAQRCSTFIACEPGRSQLNLAASRMIGVFGCNVVTQHDAVVSVRAGFTGMELSCMWPATNSWTLEERGVGVFSHLFAAHRALNLHAYSQTSSDHGSNRSSSSPIERQEELPW